MYKGVLRSGGTYSEPFEDLRIIDDYTFDKAQHLMQERVNERKENRTTPLQTAGQSMLSGNVFCGHCGGRLVLTTNGKVVRKANGETVGVKRLRYVCYNKTRRRQECDGQTGYTMRILDTTVTDILHQIFDRMAAVTDDVIIGGVHERNMVALKAEIKRVKAENTKANAEYESLKAEVLKSVQGTSKMPVDILTELVDESRDKVLDTSQRLSALLVEFEDGNAKEAEMKAELQQIRTWAEIFDTSEMDVKKMIAGYIIKRINVHKGYELDIELNMNIQQFLAGLDSIAAEAAAS
jgi:hypothetical protein